MHQKRFNDATIILENILRTNGVDCGVFGGFAMSALGRKRDTGQIQCIVGTTRSDLIDLLEMKVGFYYIDGVYEHDDRLFALWSDNPGLCNPVLFDFYCIGFEGCPDLSEKLQNQPASIEGENFGKVDISILEPALLFKAKLHAAAVRSELYHSADLRYLADNYPAQVQKAKDSLNMQHLGLALKYHPELSYTFEQMGCDLERAKTAAEVELGPLKPGDVQRIFFG